MKKTRKQALLIVWDTETYKITLDEDGSVILRPYLIGGGCENKFYYAYEPQDFFNFLIEKYQKYDLKLWAFNANYDLTVIIPEYLSKLFKEYKITYKVSEAKNFISFSYSSDFLKFKCFDAAVGNTHYPALSDGFNLIGLPPKTEIYYDKWDLTRTDTHFHYVDHEGEKRTSVIVDELEYLKRDVMGLYDVVLYQHEQKTKLCNMFELPTNKLAHKTTSPSFAKSLVNVWKGDGYFDDKFRPRIQDETLYNMQLASSCGGFTACNKNIKSYYSPDYKIYSYDINSCYPAVIYDGVPCGEIYKEIYWKRYCTWYEVTMTYCKGIDKYSHISTPPLPSKGCKITRHGVFLLKEYYETVKDAMLTDLKILDTWRQELTTDLRPLIHDLYEEKLKIDKKEPTRAQQFEKDNIKLLLNALYGKLGERTYLEETYYDVEDMRFTSKNTLKPQFRYTLSGAYIAQKARAYLIKNLLKEVDQGNIFFYCDTDSLKLAIVKDVVFKVDPHKLGGFKLEPCSNSSPGYSHFMCTGKIKKYLMYHDEQRFMEKGLKMALSGISKKVQKNLIKYGDIDTLIKCFRDGYNVSVIEGKLSKCRNKGGQVILDPLDICLNGNDKNKDESLLFDPINKKGLSKNIKHML